MSDLPEIPELPDPEHLRDPLSRIVAVATVVATLAAGVSAYLAASASRGDDLADTTAQRRAVFAQGRQLASQQDAQVSYETFVAAERQRRRASHAFQEQLFTGGEDRLRWKLEQKRRDAIAKRLEQLTPLTRESEVGPDHDPLFPEKFLARATEEPLRLSALQDAANEVSSTWESRTARFTGTIALFAVALYLFSLSFTLAPQVRRWFAALGIALLAVGFVWGVFTAVSFPRPASEESARAFAEGHVRARTASSRADYRRAIEAYTVAIGLRPTFARAYDERAGATFLYGSPQRSGFASLSDPGALASSTLDLLQARELGLDTVSVNAQLGFQTFALGVQYDDPDALEQSVEFTQAAIAQDPRDPVTRFNLGVALLAAGRVEEANEAYRQAVLHTLYQDVEAKKPRSNPGLEEEWVAGALTDLETVRTRGDPSLGDDVFRLKEYVVGSVSRGRLGAGPADITVSDAQLDVFPATIQWQGNLEGFDGDRDVLSVQWYHDTGLGAAVLTEPSGLAYPAQGTDGRQYVLRHYLPSTVPPRCLADGGYRVEVYVNGQLVDGREAVAAFPEVRAAVDRDLGLGLCRPRQWSRLEIDLPPFFAGWTSDGLDEGAYFFKFDVPKGFAGLTGVKRNQVFLNIGVRKFNSLFPSKPAFNYVSDLQYFMDLTSPRVQDYRYPGGRVFAGAGEATDGSVIVGVVFGPGERFRSGDLFDVFDSLSVVE